MNDVPEFGPLGLDREPATTRIRHPGTVRTLGTTRVTVANEDCLDKASWLTGEGLRVAVLNMASAGSPGRGVQ